MTENKGDKVNRELSFISTVLDAVACLTSDVEITEPIAVHELVKEAQLRMLGLRELVEQG